MGPLKPLPPPPLPYFGHFLGIGQQLQRQQQEKQFNLIFVLRNLRFGRSANVACTLLHSAYYCTI